MTQIFPPVLSEQRESKGLVLARWTMPSSSSRMQAKARVDAEVIQRAVLKIRGQNVLLDSDVASLYRVDVEVLNQGAGSLRSQIVTLDVDCGSHRKYLPEGRSPAPIPRGLS